MIDYGRQVVLSTLDQCHLPMLRAWRNDYQIWKWTRQNDLISEVSHDDWFYKQARDPSTRMYAICDLEKQIAGVCGLTSIDLINRRAEFSLYIAPKWRRKGYAKEALITLINHGFLNLGLHSIWGETFQGNPAYSLFMKLGFKPDGIRRNFYFREGKFINALLISLLNDEWSLPEVFQSRDSSRPTVAQASALSLEPLASFYFLDPHSP